jgi:hypothetical protein
MVYVFSQLAKNSSAATNQGTLAARAWGANAMPCLCLARLGTH